MIDLNEFGQRCSLSVLFFSLKLYILLIACLVYYLTDIVVSLLFLL